MTADRRIREALGAMGEPAFDSIADTPGVRIVRVLFLPTFHRDVLVIVECTDTVARIGYVTSGRRPRRTDEVMQSVELDNLWAASDAVKELGDTDSGRSARDGMSVRIDIADADGRRSITCGPEAGSGPIGVLITELISQVRRNLPDDEIDQALADVERYLRRED